MSFFNFSFLPTYFFFMCFLSFISLINLKQFQSTNSPVFSTCKPNQFCHFEFREKPKCQPYINNLIIYDKNYACIKWIIQTEHIWTVIAFFNSFCFYLTLTFQPQISSKVSNVFMTFWIKKKTKLVLIKSILTFAERLILINIRNKQMHKYTFTNI